MVVLFILGLIFLFCFLKSSNPLISCICLVVSLVSTLPILSLGMGEWYLYLVTMLFVSGVFVLVLYVTSVSVGMKSGGSRVMLILPFFMSPLLMFTPLCSASGPGVFFSSVGFFFVYFFIIFLSLLIIFSGYMLTSMSAMRKF